MNSFSQEYIDYEVKLKNNKMKEIELRKNFSKKLKEKMEEYFEFEITDYIIDDIVFDILKVNQKIN